MLPLLKVSMWYVTCGFNFLYRYMYSGMAKGPDMQVRGIDYVHHTLDNHLPIKGVPLELMSWPAIWCGVEGAA